MSHALDFSQLQADLDLSNDIIYKDYLNHLQLTPIVPPHINNSLNTIRLLKVITFTCPTDPSSLNHFTFALNALHSLNIALCYILKVSSTSLTVYLGISHIENSCTAFELLKNALHKTYPSIQLEILDESTCSELLGTQLLNPESTCALSSAIVIPGTNQVPSSATPLLQPLLSLLSGEEYTILFLANSLSRSSYRRMQEQLQCLYNDLFPFREINHSNTHHINTCCTDSRSHSHTQNQNITSSETNGSSTTDSKACSSNNALSLSYKTSDHANFSKNDSHGNTLTDTHATNQSTSSSCSDQASCTQSVTDSEAHTTIDIDSISHRQTNIQVINLLAQADLQLARYTRTLTLPIFNFGVYFLSASPATSIRAAATYIGLVEGSSPSIYPSFINTWEKSNPSFGYILDYLQRLKHPLFCDPLSPDKIFPAIPVTSAEFNTILSPLIFQSKF